MRSLLLICGAPLVASCFPLLPGDGWFHVTGEITTSEREEKSCELRVLNPSSPEKVLDSFKVGGSFKQTIMVPPTRATYKVELLCAGTVVATATVNYGAEDQGVADLGKIVL